MVHQTPNDGFSSISGVKSSPRAVMRTSSTCSGVLPYELKPAQLLPADSAKERELWLPYLSATNVTSIYTRK